MGIGRGRRGTAEQQGAPSPFPWDPWERSDRRATAADAIWLFIPSYKATHVRSWPHLTPWSHQISAQEVRRALSTNMRKLGAPPVSCSRVRGLPANGNFSQCLLCRCMGGGLGWNLRSTRHDHCSGLQSHLRSLRASCCTSQRVAWWSKHPQVQ